jgi:putative transposase
MASYDYSGAGAYFLTICAHLRACIFGRVVGGLVRLNDLGRMVHDIWTELPQRYPGVLLDAFVVMPNHIHGIVWLTCADGEHPEPATGSVWEPTATRDAEPMSAPGHPAVALPEVVRRFKTLTTMRYRTELRESEAIEGAARLWQRNYYEHVIRTDAALDRVRQYILDNPAAWDTDDENPGRRA